MSDLEHDSLDDRKTGKRKALSLPPANKMVEEPFETKAAQVRALRRELALETHGPRPHLHPDNPEIWEGEI